MIQKKYIYITKFLNLRVISHDEEHRPQFIMFLTEAHRCSIMTNSAFLGT